MGLDVKCEECGADVAFKPGTTSLTCQYCDHAMTIAMPELPLESQQEIDLDSYLAHFEENNDQVERTVVSCQGCGAQTELAANQQSGACAFCDTPIVVTQSKTTKLIKPKGLLPFQVTRKEAKATFNQWIKSLWFAPNDLKRQTTQHEKFKGIYLPFWTYDCDTITTYFGQRGDYYYETESYTDSEGKSQTRQVRKTRWRFVSGVIDHVFDDVLIPATRSLPSKTLNNLQPWDLNKVVDYKDEFLSGYTTENYQINVKEGYLEAKNVMNNTIDALIRQDIGGDVQQILSSEPHFKNATFKHLLLPVWVSAYRFKDKVFQVTVNAQTGELEGERPYSWIKIASLVLTVATVIAGTIYFFNN